MAGEKGKEGREGRKERRVPNPDNFRIIWNRLERTLGRKERKKEGRKRGRVEGKEGRDRSHTTNLGSVNKHWKEGKRENKTRDGKIRKKFVFLST